jgi:formylglycine-generating enzyme required for sulfatase activity
VLICIGMAATAIWLVRRKPAALTPAQSTLTSVARLFTVTPAETLTATPTIPPTPSLTPALTATPDNQALSPLDGMVLLLVPKGTFTMGSNSSGYAAEKPAHQVTLDSFWIDKFEVTNGMFLKFVNATGTVTELEKQNLSWLFNTNGWYSVAGSGWRNPFGVNSSLDGRMDHPVIQVTWNDAVKYCTWAGRRLPTEAEWEKAARGPDGNEYPWGNNAPSNDLANYGDMIGDTVPDGSYPGNASPYGAMDMAGNVYEWVADWYSGSYYASSPTSNPTGPASGTHKVMHGGSWQLDVYNLHPYKREVSQPNYGNSNLGFRCALSANP